MFRKSALAAALMTFTALAAQAQPPQPQPQQQPANPEQMKQVMQVTMGAMVAMMGPMTEAVIEAQLREAAKPETAERTAAFKKNLYDALVKKGFDQKQALEIVIATAPPSASPGSR